MGACPHTVIPFEKGKLIIQFNVEFPDSIDPAIVPKLEKLLPAKEEPMIPEDHEEVNMQDFDPESDRRQRSSMHDEDEDHMPDTGLVSAVQRSSFPDFFQI